ncbi:DnrO protein [Rhodanobacter ginsengiterrae]|uniref:DnrO protein n=1 Tax=Rhodanobacter ginsengiterrae TaxID=2008451 RepID=UPI003CEAA67B
MKSMKAVLALTCVLGVAMTAQASPAQGHGSQHADATPTAAPAPAQRWKPDAALGEGMRRAYAAVDQLRHYEMGHMSAPMAVDRASTVEEAVDFMFAHCQLAPAPDAALHGILVPLRGAAQALKQDPQDLKAVADMRAAIAHYPRYFDDPGWDAAPAMPAMHDEP